MSVSIHAGEGRGWAPCWELWEWWGWESVQPIAQAGPEVGRSSVSASLVLLTDMYHNT